jgi:hypothetical protein
MLRKLLIFTIFCSFWHQVLANSPATSEAPVKSPESSQKVMEVSRGSALQLYQKKDFTQSIAVLNELRQSEGQSADISYNLFINYLALDDIGHGLHYLRSSFELAPGYKNSINALSQLPKTWENRLQRKQSFVDRLLLNLHYYVELHPLVWVLALVFTLFFRNLVRAFKHQKEDESIPALVSTRLGVFGLASLIALVILGGKLYHNYKPKITLISNTEAHVTPKENSPKIMDLLAGELVYLIEETGQWLRVEDFDGKQAWIKKSQVEI